jgi:hypothetical protein
MTDDPEKSPKVTKIDRTIPAKERAEQLAERFQPTETRDERLKAALKANLARRKAQHRARSDADTDEGKD